MKAVSFHGFGGAFAVACANLGIELEAVVEPGGFGSQAVDRNREWLGFTGPIDTSPYGENEIYDADILIGNPPCSGFSLMNTSKGTSSSRGPYAKQNDCMWALVDYASRMNGGHGPELVIFESVQGAFAKGIDLMRALRADLNVKTYGHYDLVHLKVSGATLGASQVRRRYFWIATKRSFGIESPPLGRVVTYEDAIGDLNGQPLGSHPYVNLPSSGYSAELRSMDGIAYDHVMDKRRWSDRYSDLNETWEPGKGSKDALRAWFDKYGEPPESWRDIDCERHMSGAWFSDVYRVRPDSAGRVITGAGGYDFFHWEQPRTLTVRETARLMGFPDDFRWDFAPVAKMFAFHGKQVPVQSWQWALSWVQANLNGEGGLWFGEEIGQNERLIDVTNDFRAIYNERTRQQPVDSRSPAHRAAMEARPTGRQRLNIFEPVDEILEITAGS